MPPAVYFKYRSLDNWKFLVDILLEHRLYAAPFEKLNDPMEGRYRYQGDTLTEAFLATIGQSKEYWRICSLTRTPTNTLMWSYYGGGHTGVALGVRIPTRRQPLKVRYDSFVNIDATHLKRPARAVAIEILSQKLLSWEHEEEFRFFSAKPYVNVEVERIILGCRMPSEDRKHIRTLAGKLAPKARIVQLRSSHLDKPIDRLGR